MCKAAGGELPCSTGSSARRSVMTQRGHTYIFKYTFQAGIWSGLPRLPPRDLPDPQIKPPSLTSSALAGRFFTTRQKLLPLSNYCSLESKLFFFFSFLLLNLTNYSLIFCSCIMMCLGVHSTPPLWVWSVLEFLDW